MRRRKKIALGLVGLLALLGGLELYCRYHLGLGDPPLSRADPEIEYMFVGPRTYHRFGNTISYNSFNMRSREMDARRPKDSKEIRILVLGDSVINGGSLTDQSQLMTTLLENRLASKFQRPTVVMNVSAGSWGPPNYWAYVRRLGLFEADVLVIVVSSHDASDAPTYEPVVGVDPNFPDKTPTFALQEAIFRYLPGYLPSFGAPPPKPRERSQGEFDSCISAFRELITFAGTRKPPLPVIVVQHLEKPEIGQPESEGHRLFREECEKLKVLPIEWSPAFEASLKAGKDPYRDVIHPNALGQQIMEDTLEPEVVRLLPKPAPKVPVP